MKFIFSLLFLLALSSCATTPDEEKLPVITHEMDVDTAIELAIKHGNPVLKDVLKMVRATNRKDKAVGYLISHLNERSRTESTHQLMTALYLYGELAKSLDLQLFSSLLADKRIAVRQSAWGLAARFPSETSRKYIEGVLSQALVSGLESVVMLPEMAVAVRNHGIRSVYTLIRRGLLEGGDAEFAKTMIKLNPEKARFDFMDYLGRATIEDLRQLNQKTVDLHATLVILNFYKSNDIPLFHPKVGSLFLFSISRNRALAEVATEVLEKETGRYSFELALILARLPQWIQVAFVESQKGEQSTKVGVLLGHLREITPSKQVIEEINSQAR